MPHRNTRGFSLLLTCALLLLGTTSAQTKVEKTKKKLPTFDKKQLADLLSIKRQEMLEKMVSERHVKKGKKRVAKWLAGFQIVQSEHYLVYTNGPTRTVKRFAKTLEKLYNFIRLRFPFEEIEHKLTAYVFNQKDEYVDFCVKIRGWSRKQAQGTAGHASGAYYATYYQSPSSVVVIHEATHQIVYACLRVPGVGSWFQEGFAVYFEKIFLNGKPSATMRTAFRNGGFYELEDLVKIRSLLSDPKGHGTRNYEHAGALIDFMINSKLPEVSGKFPAFLEAARKGRYRRKAADGLIRQVYGLSVKELGAVWKKHHKAPRAKSKNR